MFANLDVVVLRKGSVDLVGQCAELVLQLLDEGPAIDREVDEFAIARQFFAEFVPRYLMFAGIIVLVAVLDVNVAGVEFTPELAEHA
ncbi:hypothetical protein D9M72_602710 [compost metagenome]